MQSTHLRDLGDLRRRVNEIEERVPWVGVASGWAEQRGAWVEQLQSQEPTCAGLGRILLTLEGALLPESMAPQWAFAREGWRGRVAASIFPEMLHIAIDDFEHAIEWHRILLAPDGRFPTQAGLGSAELRNTGSVGLPRPIGALTGEEAARPPPEGLPRAAARMLLLLRAMGVRQYDPGVALQLLEVMHFYTAEVLTDAQAYARLRWLGACARSGQHAAQQVERAEKEKNALEANLKSALDVTAELQEMLSAQRELAEGYREQAQQGAARLRAIEAPGGSMLGYRGGAAAVAAKLGAALGEHPTALQQRVAAAVSVVG